MTELERVPIETGEVVENGSEDVWELAASMWAEGAARELIGQLQQAKAVSLVARAHGYASVEKWAGGIGVSKSLAYDRLRVYQVFGDRIENGYFSGRLESGKLTFQHLLEASRTKDPLERLDDAEDRELSASQMQHERKELEEAGQEEDFGKSEKVLTTRICEACGSEVPVV